MTKRPVGGLERRRRIRVMAIAAAAVGIVTVAGVGTAHAGGWHWKKHRSAGTSWTGRRATQPAVTPSGPATSPSVSVPATGPSGSGSSGPAGSGSASSSGSGGSGRVTPPPVNVGVDYQIGAPYQPPAGVRVVSRDHGVAPAAGVYNICYVNAFQTQPGENDWWRRNHGDLLLRQGSSEVADEAWGELILDISTAAKRSSIMTVVGGWIDECAAKGFQAVEPDNLDTWTRSRGLLTRAHAEAMAGLLVSYAHGKGLAVGQKNAVELSRVGASGIGFDYAVAEDCANYELDAGVLECQGYVDAYGANVIVIEYDGTHFQRACERYGGKLSIVQRDRDVTSPGSSSYVYKSC